MLEAVATQEAARRRALARLKEATVASTPVAGVAGCLTCRHRQSPARHLPSNFMVGPSVYRAV
jgi:hypothetical protein